MKLIILCQNTFTHELPEEMKLTESIEQNRLAYNFQCPKCSWNISLYFES